MTLGQRIWAVLREAAASGRSQPAASLLTMVIVAGMCAAVLLTTGRSVGAEDQVVASLNSASTRTIIVRANPAAHLSPHVLTRVKNISGITWAAAFSAAEDVSNARVSGGTLVPFRTAWGPDLRTLGTPPDAGNALGLAWTSTDAMRQLGLADGAGGLETVDGQEYGVGGVIRVPSYLSFMQPLVIKPATSDSGTVGVLVVVVRQPDLVEPVSEAVKSVLAVDDISQITVSTGTNLTSLRQKVQGQLLSFGANLVVLIFALTAFLVAAIVYGLVTLRRKDFGRRRALGASQQLIILLLVTQVAMLSLCGALFGDAVALVALFVSHAPIPSSTFFVSVSVLSLFVGVASAFLPAIAAARRDPLTELRVP